VTLFYLIHLLNNKSTQVKMTTREEEKISFYTFPRGVRSHNVNAKHCLVQKRKLYENAMQIPTRTLLSRIGFRRQRNSQSLDFNSFIGTASSLALIILYSDSLFLH